MDSIFDTPSDETEEVIVELKIIRDKFHNHSGGLHRLFPYYQSLKQADVDRIDAGETPRISAADWIIIDKQMVDLVEKNESSLAKIKTAFTSAKKTFATMTPTPPEVVEVEEVVVEEVVAE